MNKLIQNRLKRVAGQIQKLEKDIGNEISCQELIPQFMAAKGALNAAFLEYVKNSIAQCKKSDKKTMEDLIAHLIKS